MAEILDGATIKSTLIGVRSTQKRVIALHFNHLGMGNRIYLKFQIPIESPFVSNVEEEKGT